MRKTILKINKQLFWDRICLLWYDVRIVLHIVYLIFDGLVYMILAHCFEKLDLSILAWLSFLMWYYNIHIISKNIESFNEEYDEMKSKRIDLLNCIYENKELKKAIKEQTKANEDRIHKK